MRYKYNVGDRIRVTMLDFDEVDFEGTICNLENYEKSDNCYKYISVDDCGDARFDNSILYTYEYMYANGYDCDEYDMVKQHKKYID